MANLLPPLKPIPIKERLSVLYIEKGHLDARARGDEPRSRSAICRRGKCSPRAGMNLREETRYPGFYYRMDKNYIDDENWKCFVNSTYDRNTHQWALKKVPYKQLIKD